MNKLATRIVLAILLTVPLMAGNLNTGGQILSEPTLQKFISGEAGTVYYVDGTSGSDSYPGTQAMPWKTIRKAANTLKGGDTAIVKSGTYNERVVVSNSGSSGSLIGFEAQGTVQCQGFTLKGNYIQVKGFKVTATLPTWDAEGYGIWVEGANCIIDNNYAYYCPTGGIVTTASSAACIIRNNRCQRNAFNGIEIGGVSHLVENNEIWATISYHTPTNWSPGGDANGIMVWGSGHIFRRNYIHDISYNDLENQSYAPLVDAFQTAADGRHPGGTTNVLFERNLVVLTGYRDSSAHSVAFRLREAGSITIRNNIVIAFSGTETGENGGTCHHVRIQNNTFIGSLTYPISHWPIGISLENCPYATVDNNIVYDQANYSIYLSGSSFAGLEIGYNCAYNSDGTTPLGAPQPSDLWGVNPKFVNASGRDFHLQSSSPCINAGTAVADNTVDYDGNPRPVGGGWDIGAFEYTGLEPPLSASISASPTSGPVPLTVKFTGSASGGTPPYTYRWDFGDGQSSTIQNPSHTYSTAGDYTATLTVTDNVSATAKASVNISAGNPALNATITANPKSGDAPLTVEFKGSASGGKAPYTYGWDFGDGQSSAAQEETHTYSTAGTFTVTFTVTDSVPATATATEKIDVSVTPSLHANINASPTSGKAPQTVRFSGSASGGKPPYTYSWDFGDGLSGTGQYIFHIYSGPGTYFAALTVRDSVGTENITSVTIIVKPLNPYDPVALFSASPDHGLFPLQVYFDASASYAPAGSITGYDWDFGDGQGGSGKTVSHIYYRRGTIPVTLRITDSSLRTATATKEILVLSKPTALFTYRTLISNAPWILGFDASASYDPYGTIVAYQWNFGDGSSGSGKTIVHAFPKQGTYIVKLTVINDQDYPSEIAKTINVEKNKRERRK
jgi:parallel beta-helix repeat protein